ncbi:cation:proton antiporter [Gemmatimonadota bacterium]
MTTFDLLALLISLTAFFGWVNHRFVRLPATVGLMIISMAFSLALVALGKAGVGGTDLLAQVLGQVDFGEALLHGMLGALLFAGALHININDLRENKWVISLLATVGVIVSTVLVGTGAWIIFRWIGFEIPFVFALLFGALISPTDPIAVGAILRKAGVPRSLFIKITGESLFNDGVGVVLFLLILELSTGGSGHGAGEAVSAVVQAGSDAQHASDTTGITLGQILNVLGVEVVGGLVFGGVMGWIVYRMLKSVDAYQVEILLTLAVVTGGYALAQLLHVSGPLAMVVAGLLIGNRGRSLAMSEETIRHLDSFWELADEFLNALLFVMIGIEVLILDYAPGYLLAGVLAIPLILASRMVSVALPVTALRPFRAFSPHVVKILTWSGLRGGISVALALSLPQGPFRDLLVTATYVVVVFSIVFQGLTVGPAARKLSEAARS